MTKSQFNPAEFALALKALLNALPEEREDLSSIPTRRVAELRADILRTIEKLSALSMDLDPVKRPALVFDPSDPHTVGLPRGEGRRAPRSERPCSRMLVA